MMCEKQRPDPNEQLTERNYVNYDLYNRYHEFDGSQQTHQVTGNHPVDGTLIHLFFQFDTFPIADLSHSSSQSGATRKAKYGNKHTQK